MSKIKTKKILIILLLLIVSVCFCACGKINSSIITNEDGSIDEIVTIKLDIDQILEKGYSLDNIEDLKTDIRIDAQKQANLMKQNLNDKVLLQLSIPDLDEETKNVLESFYDGITIKESNWKNNQYSIKVKFKNINVYKYYYDIKDDNSVEMKQEEYFFYNKVYWYGNTMFLKHRDLYENLKAKYEINYPNLINYTDSQLTYTYCADLRRQHSDADFVEKVNGKYYHTWIIDQENPYQQIMFYYNVANTYNWIIVSLLATLSVTVIFGFVAILIKILNKNKKIIKK